MQDSFRAIGRKLIQALALSLGLALAHALLIAPAPSRADATSNAAAAEAPTFSDVVFFDGSEWKGMELTNGSVEGPAGGASPTARVKAGLGGPKTYFLLGGDASRLSVPVARPRFRFTGVEGTARRLQLAQFEVKEGLRRTTIEIGKGVTTFKKGSELEVTKVSDGLWEVKPKKSLQPGEYALVLSESGPVADFKVGDSGY